jgi:hypothetical protein
MNHPHEHSDVSHSTQGGRARLATRLAFTGTDTGFSCSTCHSLLRRLK